MIEKYICPNKCRGEEFSIATPDIQGEYIFNEEGLVIAIRSQDGCLAGLEMTCEKCGYKGEVEEFVNPDWI